MPRNDSAESLASAPRAMRSNAALSNRPGTIGRNALMDHSVPPER
jgi:hypothetical protein